MSAFEGTPLDIASLDCHPVDLQFAGESVDQGVSVRQDQDSWSAIALK
jgi:hypothetical protein